MKCFYCGIHVKCRDHVPAGPLFVGEYFQLGHAHEVCKDEAIERYNVRQALEQEEAKLRSIQKGCPFGVGYKHDGTCRIDDCMAWKGTDCGRLVK